ncbi:hypothetical protein EDD29_4739 [Actinocorallia herbida]|uniref:Uncharacterized protein n=1 Tax=Actinocorallia herbida TaxID=58109 RepID=A0A3N1D0T9_9ACTN|nr:hypothetical protein [Actinocorallia herbida]ROO87147.1 hypothetical protein EDD29_4739 [Actinocorallia herbida]
MVVTAEFWREDHLLSNPEHAGAVFVAEPAVAEFTYLLEQTVTALG